MLTQLLKEHQTKQQARRETQEKKKIEAVNAANLLTHAVVDQLNQRVSQAYNNQKRLDIEAKKLQHNTGILSKQTSQWIQLIDNFNQALKEIGDAENWAATMENDMKAISGALEHAYKARQEGYDG